MSAPELDAERTRFKIEDAIMNTDGPGVAIITDHAFVPRGEWWTVCGFEPIGFAESPSVYPCGLAEAAHATTTVDRTRREL